MFKLAELSLGYFAIIEENDELSVMPVKVHGMMCVTNINKKYNTDLLIGVSKELLESGEIESLKREAIEQTEEAVEDEFTD